MSNRVGSSSNEDNHQRELSSHFFLMLTITAVPQSIKEKLYLLQFHVVHAVSGENLLN